MPKVKIARKSTLVDMTPMCDVAFLLLTFFMLTTKFKPQEPIEVVTPAAVSTELLPEAHVAMVTISKDGRVFFGIDNQNERLKLIQSFNDSYSLGLSAQQMENYARSAVVGMPLNTIDQYLNIEPTDRGSFKQTGIPIDSTKGELKQWISYTRNVTATPKQLKFVIKADNSTHYKVVHRVLDIFKEEGIHKLHLITSLKGIPPGTPLFKTSNAGTTE